MTSTRVGNVSASAYPGGMDRRHASTPTGLVTPGLTDREKAILTLAGAFYRGEGARESHMWQRFDLSPARFWQSVNRLCDMEAAEVWDAQLVRRLRARRDSGRPRIPRS